MHRIIRTKAYEAKHGPHFDEEHARKAVSKMENEDGSRGQHWSVEETSALANQYGIRFDSKFNKYDWYVALNMVYSDYYGFDAGLAALMQNANKGMDPAALMAMMNNNGGFGGNGGWWWIWIILIFFCWGGWGGNGFGNRGGEASQLASQLNTDANTSLLMQAINGNKEAISNLSNTLNCDFNSVQSALNTINASVNQIACDTKLSSQQVINAITSGNASLASELANCCCTTQRSIDGVNLNLTKMGYENQLAVCNQTNNLVNTMNSNTLSLRDNGTANTNAIIAKLDAMQNQALLDKIDSLREKNSTLVSQLSQEHQTATFGTMISQATTPIVTKLNALQSDVDGIKCKLPNTVSVPYPQLSVYNPEVFRAAAYGAFAGDTYANCGIGYNNCGC